MKIRIMAPLALLSAVGLTGVSPTAGAASWWGQPGADCHAYYSADTSKFNDYGWTAKIKTGTGSAWLNCTPQVVATTSYPSAVNVYLNHPSARTSTCYYIRTNYLTGATSLVSKNISGSGNLQGAFTPLPTKRLYDINSVSCYLPTGTILRDVFYYF